MAWIDRVAGLTRLYNPRSVLRWNGHKSYLREIEAAGVAIVPTLWLEAGSTADVAALVATEGWTRGFLKPMVGANSRESIRFEADAAGLAVAQAHVDRLLPAEGLMLQPYMAQVETVGEISTFYFDGEFSHAVQKVPLSGDFRVQDDHGATDFPVALSAAFREASDRVVEALAGDPLYARVDFHTGDKGEPLLGEVELIEPSLFFRHDPHAAGRLAEALLARVRARSRGGG